MRGGGAIDIEISLTGGLVQFQNGIVAFDISCHKIDRGGNGLRLICRICGDVPVCAGADHGEVNHDGGIVGAIWQATVAVITALHGIRAIPA